MSLDINAFVIKRLCVRKSEFESKYLTLFLRGIFNNIGFETSFVKNYL